MFALGPLNLPITANYRNLAQTASVSLTGFSVTTSINSLTVYLLTTVSLNGLSAQADVGSILVWGLIPPGPSGNWTQVVT